MAKSTPTEKVLQHHVQSVMSRKVDDIMKDYTEDSVLFTPSGSYKGLKAIRAAFTAMMETFTPEVMGNMKLIKQDIEGDYACAMWTAAPAILFGGDTFCVRNGKIAMQSFVGELNR